MSREEKRLCNSCSGRWDRLDFWHACPNKAQASEERWGGVYDQAFGSIKKARNCRLCRLIYKALTRLKGSSIPEDTRIYYSRFLFGDYESRSTASRDHGTTSSLNGPGESAWQRHFVNHLCVSTFPSASETKREHLEYIQEGMRPGEYYECLITLLQANEDYHNFLHGRPIGSTFDTRIAKKWMDECDKKHDSECSGQSTTRQPRRVINIKSRCIQHTPTPCSYIALSYRWPDPPGLMLKSANEDTLMKTNGLTHYSDVLHVVQDAIALVEKLGQNFLWVDALCIPQEGGRRDERLELERKDQINAMPDIYLGANLTIVACTDPNTENGLPGFRDGTRSSQKTAYTDTLAFAVTKPELFEAVDRVVVKRTVVKDADPGSTDGQGVGTRAVKVKGEDWNSRFWTFQEAALSRRLLIFTDGQVFFHCHGAMWKEDTHDAIPNEATVSQSSRQTEYRMTDLPHRNAPYWRNRSPLQPLPFLNWIEAVQLYTARTGSREEDFSKGLEFLKRQNRTFCCIPEGYFARALCFTTWEGERRNLNSPTWCWCRWKVPRGVSYEFGPDTIEAGPNNFIAAHFFKVVYDHTKCELDYIPIKPNATSLQDAAELSESRDKSVLPDRVAFAAPTLEGTLRLGPEGLRENCTISFAHPNSSSHTAKITFEANALLALDCGKEEGDQVTCARVGRAHDVGSKEIWLLVIEFEDKPVARRIGTATIPDSVWEEVGGGQEMTRIFLF
ncbi:heterokaryon incompatibility protein-domain-containing protein [Paraphoma chrysanthemicola]|uniref:Heterokaryon incompatibility protein-domain-containing protein n=1 Tax=Paraphoma chrysanthemicola TaxID=798071 RepID=A0A8K0QXN6_9PLEO|nr:heterokaryon incompatibility protein-domain-containing protein [Paraphoma chrysanthemicola]